MTDRSFTIVSVKKNGQKGRPKTSGMGGRFIGSSPSSVASKMHSGLCRDKKIKGQCAFIITLKETTQGSKKKSYTYKTKRTKLKTPLVIKRGKAKITIKYTNTVKSVKSI